MISLNEKKLKARAEGGDKKAEKMLGMIEEPTRFLSTIQVGITLAGFLGAAFAADNFGEKLSGYLVSTFGLPDAYTGTVNTVAVILITLLLSFFTLVLGELVPKRIAMRHKERFAEYVCETICALSVILGPVVSLLTLSTNAVLRLLGMDPEEKEESVSEEDIVIMLDAGADEGTLNEDDITYIKNVFKLDKQVAAEVMTHRKAVTYIAADATKEEVLEIIQKDGYSRMPVYGENADDIIGILYARDFLLKYTDADFSLEQAMMPPTFIPESMHLDVLIKEMQGKHTHMVIVVNEYGVPSGIVTMEDILEEIVGEIWDESDEAVDSIKKLEDGTYRVLCTTSTEDFFEFFDITPEEESESATVNGWLTEQSGNIPDKGDTLEYQRLIITVTVADELMAHEIHVRIREEAPEEAS